MVDDEALRRLARTDLLGLGKETLMARHFLELEGAETVDTEPFLLARRAIADLYDASAMGAMHGEAGTGKTFAVEDALRQTPQVRVVLDHLPVAADDAYGGQQPAGGAHPHARRRSSAIGSRRPRCCSTCSATSAGSS